MKKFAKIMLIALGVGLVAGVIGVLTSTPTTAQLPLPPITVVPVKVTNTPLPTTVTNTISGNVNVGNFPATQNVTGTVAVSSLPDVTLNNGNTNPLFTRDVDNPANEPFQAALCYGVTGGAATNQCSALGTTQPSQFAVPTMTTDGKTVKALVIQFVDGSCTVSSGGVILELDLSTQIPQNVIPGDSPGFHVVPFSLNPLVTSNTVLQWATPMHAIVLANDAVSFSLATQSGTSCGCTMHLSGYLVTQ